MKDITFNKRKTFLSIDKIKNSINNYFSNYIKNFDVKLIFENDFTKTWIFISDDDFYFVNDVKSNCIIYQISRYNFKFKVIDFCDKNNLSKLYIDDVTYPIIVDNNIDVEKILNNYRLNLVD